MFHPSKLKLKEKEGSWGDLIRVLRLSNDAEPRSRIDLISLVDAHHPYEIVFRGQSDVQTLSCTYIDTEKNTSKTCIIKLKQYGVNIMTNI